MSLDGVKKVAIVGAGTMGLGIAQTSAISSFSTVLFDIEEGALDKAKIQITKNLDKGIEKGKLKSQDKENALQRLSFTTDFGSLSADFIIEAVVERLDVKQKLFSDLEKQNAEDSIFASNTSSIPITRIGAALSHPERLIGMHFFNPAHIMKLVEVISGAATSDMVIEKTKQVAEKMGKVPVVANDSPGFIVNRVARHFYVESLKILEEGVADVNTIDALIRSSGFKMGPFELMDLIGVDTNFSVTQSMFDSFHKDGKFRPSRIQEQKVAAGHHGRKTGKGFYDYS